MSANGGNGNGDGGSTPGEQLQQTVESVQQQRTSRIDTYIHAVIVMTVLLSATALRVVNDLDVATLSTVYGAALGYATGLTISRKAG